MSFHLALLGPTGAHLLDDPPDLSCRTAPASTPWDGSLLSCKQLFCVGEGWVDHVCEVPVLRLLRPADTGRRDLGPPSPATRYQPAKRG